MGVAFLHGQRGNAATGMKTSVVVADGETIQKGDLVNITNNEAYKARINDFISLGSSGAEDEPAIEITNSRCSLLGKHGTSRDYYQATTWATGELFPTDGVGSYDAAATSDTTNEVCPFGNNRLLRVQDDSSISSRRYSVYNCSSNNVTVTSTSATKSNASNYVDDVIKIEDYKAAVISFRSSNVTVHLATYNGSTVTQSDPLVISGAGSGVKFGIYIDENRLLVNTDSNEAALVDVSGTTPTLLQDKTSIPMSSSNTLIGAYGANNIFRVAVSGTSILMYQYDNTLTLTNTYTLATIPSTVTSCRITKLSDTKYSVQYNDTNTKVFLVDISATTPTVSDVYVTSLPEGIRFYAFPSAQKLGAMDATSNSTYIRSILLSYKNDIIQELKYYEIAKEDVESNPIIGDGIMWEETSDYGGFVIKRKSSNSSSTYYYYIGRIILTDRKEAILYQFNDCGTALSDGEAGDTIQVALNV